MWRGSGREWNWERHSLWKVSVRLLCRMEGAIVVRGEYHALRLGLEDQYHNFISISNLATAFVSVYLPPCIVLGATRDAFHSYIQRPADNRGYPASGTTRHVLLRYDDACSEAF
jgi:hypothetical protein